MEGTLNGPHVVALICNVENRVSFRYEKVSPPFVPQTIGPSIEVYNGRVHQVFAGPVLLIGYYVSKRQTDSGLERRRLELGLYTMPSACLTSKSSTPTKVHSSQTVPPPPACSHTTFESESATIVLKPRRGTRALAAGTCYPKRQSLPKSREAFCVL